MLSRCIVKRMDRGVLKSFLLRSAQKKVAEGTSGPASDASLPTAEGQVGF